jgi:hypothetical protein
MRKMCQAKRNPLAGQPFELSWIQKYFFVLINGSKALEFDKRGQGSESEERWKGGIDDQPGGFLEASRKRKREKTTG